RPLPSRARRAGRGVLHARRVKRGAPASVVILSELKVVALAMHPHGDVPDAFPRVQPGAKRVQRAIVREHRTPGEAERRHQESAALVRHAAKLLGRWRHVNVQTCPQGASTGTAGFRFGWFASDREPRVDCRWRCRTSVVSEQRWYALSPNRDISTD